MSSRRPETGARSTPLPRCSHWPLLWSLIGRVDVVAIAQAWVIPSGKVKLNQPIEIGSVRSLGWHS